jgi:hypothetical protein
MEFIKDSGFQTTDRLVVKLFAALGKRRPKGTRAVLSTLEKGAKRSRTVQTSKTRKTQQIPAIQAIRTVMAWAMQ